MRRVFAATLWLVVACGGGSASEDAQGDDGAEASSPEGQDAEGQDASPEDSVSGHDSASGADGAGDSPGDSEDTPDENADGDGSTTEAEASSGAETDAGDDADASTTSMEASSGADSATETGDEDETMESGQEDSEEESGGSGDPPEGSPCGWQGQGKVHHVAEDIQLCLPPTICNVETCQAGLGACPDGKAGACEFKDGYDGLKTLPEAWATHYCKLTDEGGCRGTLEAATLDVRETVQAELNIPYCYKSKTSPCLGIVAFSPLMLGNSRLAKDDDGQYIRHWGLGMTPASGLCYEVEGPTGRRVVVAVTDRCAGYCDCGGGMEECGNCLAQGAQDPEDVTPSCPCVGDVPSLGDGGKACPQQQTCDWCMSNSHPHFDLDNDTFDFVCDTDASLGSCKLASVKPLPCMEPTTWPCPEGSWFCLGDNPTGQIPGTYCCRSSPAVAALPTPARRPQ